MNVLLILELIMHNKCPLELQLDVYVVQRLCRCRPLVEQSVHSSVILFFFYSFFLVLCRDF